MKQFLHRKMCSNPSLNKKKSLNDNNASNKEESSNSPIIYNYSSTIDNNPQEKQYVNPLKHFRYIGHASDKSINTIKGKKTMKPHHSPHSPIHHKQKSLSSFNVSQQSTEVKSIKKVYVIDKNSQLKQLALIDNVTQPQPTDLHNNIPKSISYIETNGKSKPYSNDHLLTYSAQSPNSSIQKNKSCDRFNYTNQKYLSTMLLSNNEDDIHRLTVIKDHIENMIQLKSDLHNETLNHTRTPSHNHISSHSQSSFKEIDREKKNPQGQMSHQHNYYKKGFIVDNDSDMDAETRNKYEREREKLNDRITGLSNSTSKSHQYNLSPSLMESNDHYLRESIPEAYERSMSMNSKDQQYTYYYTNSNTLKNIDNDLNEMNRSNNGDNERNIIAKNRTVLNKGLDNENNKESNQYRYNNRYEDSNNDNIGKNTKTEENQFDEGISNQQQKYNSSLRGYNNRIEKNKNSNSNSISQEKKGKLSGNNYIIEENSIEDDKEDNRTSGPMSANDDNINNKPKKLKASNNQTDNSTTTHIYNKKTMNSNTDKQSLQKKEDLTKVNLESLKRRIKQSHQQEEKDAINQSSHKQKQCTCKKNQSPSKCNYQCKQCLMEKQKTIESLENISLKSSYKATPRDIIEQKIEQFLQDQRTRSLSAKKSPRSSNSYSSTISINPLLYSDKKNKHFLKSLIELQNDMLHPSTLPNQSPSKVSPIKPINNRVLLTPNISTVPNRTITEEYYEKVIKKAKLEDVDPFYLKFPNNRVEQGNKNTNIDFPLFDKRMKTDPSNHHYKKSECSILTTKHTIDEPSSYMRNYSNHCDPKHSSSNSSLNSPRKTYQTIQPDNDYHLDIPFKNSRVFRNFTSKLPKGIL